MLSNVLFQTIYDLKPTKKSFMKLFSSLSIIRGIGYLLVFILCMSCKKDYNSTDPSQLSPESISQCAAPGSVLSQTKTANRFNWFGEGVLPNLWPKIRGMLNMYRPMIIHMLIQKSCRRVVELFSFSYRIFVLIYLPDATIESITVNARRFKTGKGSIRIILRYLIRNIGCYPTPVDHME